jgi:hypothetical protein
MRPVGRLRRENQANSRLNSLIIGNLLVETGSPMTAHTTKNPSLAVVFKPIGRVFWLHTTLNMY